MRFVVSVMLFNTISAFVIPGKLKCGSDEAMITAGYFGGDMVGFKLDSRNGIIDRDAMWSNSVIPYAVDPQMEHLIPLINKAIEHYNNVTCIRFRPRTNETDYVYFSKTRGCSSPVGRQGGKQIVSLDRGCEYLGTVIHEMMHVVGFWHEQNRPDRDDYITVYYSNIIRGMAYNFAKFRSNEVDTLGVEYDYKSVMHYGEYSFSADGRSPTLVAKKKGVRIGDVWEKKSLSDKDIKKINLLYNCTNIE